MSSPLLSAALFIYPGDIQLQGLYAGLNSLGKVGFPQVVRQNGLYLQIAALAESITTYRQWDPINIASGCTVSVALDNQDLFPTSGNFGITYGPTITGSLTNGSPTLTTTNTTGVTNGFLVTGPGVSTGTTVSSFVANTSITLSANATASETAQSYLVAPTPTVLPSTVTAPALQTALNAISGFPGCTVTLSGTDFIITWNATGAAYLLYPASISLYPASAIEVDELQVGSVTVKEQQRLSIYQLPAAEQTTWTALPTAGYAIQTVTGGGSGVKAVQILTLTPPPYDGTFVVTTAAGNTAPIPVAANGTQVAAALNAVTASNWAVTGNAGGPWAITELSGTAVSALTVITTALQVLTGVTGLLNLNTPGMIARFESLPVGTETFEAILEVNLQFAGQDPQTILQYPVTVSKNVIRNGGAVPPAYQTALTLAQALTLFDQQNYGSVNLGSGVGPVVNLTGLGPFPSIPRYIDFFFNRNGIGPVLSANGDLSTYTTTTATVYLTGITTDTSSVLCYKAYL